MERAAEPIVDASTMVTPRPPRVGPWLETIVLKTLEVVGEREPARMVVREARAVEPLVGPPDLSLVEARVRCRARRQDPRVERRRLEHAQAR